MSEDGTLVVGVSIAIRFSPSDMRRLLEHNIEKAGGNPFTDILPDGVERVRRMIDFAERNGLWPPGTSLSNEIRVDAEDDSHDEFERFEEVVDP